MKISMLALVFFVILYVGDASANALKTSPKNISTFDIASNSIPLSCLKWKPVGTCFWLKCSFVFCSIKLSLKVKHYIPDTVISVYNNTGENPWEMMSFIDDIGKSFALLLMDRIGDGNILSKGRSRTSTKIIFKNATAIGNPLASTYDTMGFGGEFLCEAVTTSFIPSFSSAANGMFWRYGVVDGLLNPIDTLTIGKREVGERKDGESWLFSRRWGNVFPRSGFVVQQHDYKAAAVVAQRVANIITSNSAPYIYSDINGSNKEGYWPPKQEANESDSSTANWQMLLPIKESTCHLFGEQSSDIPEPLDPANEKLSSKGSYVWNLWRPYSCCKDRGSFLFDVSWE